MAHCGVASRRKCEEYILAGRVKVNQQIVKELGTQIDTEHDRVYFDGVRLNIENEKVYIMLHKPIGVVTTVSDEKNRKAVVDLVNISQRIYPVGRLDIDTTGLLILTNDGELANILTHPSKKIPKTYIATVKGKPDAKALKKIRDGIDLGDYVTSPAKVKILKNFDTDSILEITIHEGKNHQVKRMCGYIGHEVKKLKRISIGQLTLGGLNIGNYRFLTDEEIQYLKSMR